MKSGCGCVRRAHGMRPCLAFRVMGGSFRNFMVIFYASPAFPRAVRFAIICTRFFCDKKARTEGVASLHVSPGHHPPVSNFGTLTLLVRKPVIRTPFQFLTRVTRALDFFYSAFVPAHNFVTAFTLRNFTHHTVVTSSAQIEHEKIRVGTSLSSLSNSR
jgi:hypothetical protein